MKWFFAVFFGASILFLSAFGVNCLYGYFYPIKYQEIIQQSCENFDIEQAVIYSVINVESHFNKDAISSKGAVGLMQIMPATAEELAKETMMGDDYDLKNPEENITLGTYYISKLIDRFEDLETALCAYNAGPTNVSNWLANKDYSEDGKSLKEIPYQETRNYLEKFKTNFKYYSKKL